MQNKIHLLMFHYITELIKSDSIFWICALVGSGIFFIQFLVNIFGIADHDSLDANGALSNDQYGSDAVDGRQFKWLSIQTITGFLMMFGWTALTCQKQFNLSNSTTIGIALFAGTFTAIVMRFILKLVKKLRSSGNIYRIEDAIGKEAYVYHRIPKGGVGKISLSLQNLTHEIDAISFHAEDLPSFSRVKIIEKQDDKTVIVIPL
jgi:hypothetical protein